MCRAHAYSTASSTQHSATAGLLGAKWRFPGDSGVLTAKDSVRMRYATSERRDEGGMRSICGLSVVSGLLSAGPNLHHQ